MDMVASEARKVEAIVRAVRVMHTRMSWELISSILRRVGIHVGRGLDDTLERFSTSPTIPGQLDRALSEIRDCLTVHSYVGTKQVLWYDLNELNANDRKAVVDWVQTTDEAALIPHIATFSPAAVSLKPQDLDPLTRRGPKLVGALRQPGILHFQYFSARAYARREPIDVASLSVEQRAPFQEYSEVIGVKSVSVPCFDILTFDLQRQRIELRIDTFDGIRGDVQDQAVVNMLSEANELTFQAITLRPVGLGHKNFFPAVDRFYKNKRAGSVTMLGFVAVSDSTSSNNKGMPHMRRGADLRKDAFHIGGKENVKSIRPYAIGVSWQRNPEPLSIELKGTVRMLYKRPFISEAVFTGCSTFDDYAFLSDELGKRLKA